MFVRYQYNVQFADVPFYIKMLSKFFEVKFANTAHPDKGL